MLQTEDDFQDKEGWNESLEARRNAIKSLSIAVSHGEERSFSDSEK